MKLLYYGIRHKASGELMPESSKKSGYSHWNPSNPESKFRAAMPTPRLLDTRKKAARCIIAWANNPNAEMKGGYTGDWDGTWEADLEFKEDGRRKEDLEVVEITLIIK